jgi:hypothetical protein
MKYKILQIIANKGVESVFPSVLSTISDFKKEDYSKSEIKEMIREHFFGIDTKLDLFIINQGY